MKKIFIVLFAMLFCVAAKVNADSYSTVLTTYTVGSNTTTFASNFPNIAAGIEIDKLTFSTTEALSAPILISVYNNATSTTIAGATANADQGFWVLPSSPTVTGAQQTSRTYEYPYYNPRAYTNPAFYMKANGTGKKVYLDIDYR